MGWARPLWVGNQWLLYHLLNIPDEGADAYLFVAFVQLADGEEEVLHLAVVDDGEDGVIHFGPGVGAAVRFAVDVAAPLHILPEGEAADGEDVEHVFDTFGVGLIENDEYAFHVESALCDVEAEGSWQRGMPHTGPRPFGPFIVHLI